MIEIQNSVTKAHENILKIIEEGIVALADNRWDDKPFKETQTELLYKIKVEIARSEGFITGKISAAQKEPLSIKL